MGRFFRLLFVGSILVVNVVAAAKPAQAATTLHVGSVQTYSKIQDAIDASVDGDTVLVHDGTYVENINFNGKAITVKSENGADSTTIDGNQSGSVVTFDSGEGASSVLDGFIITNGNGTGNEWYTEGGGIYCKGSSPTITNCTISGNVTRLFYSDASPASGGGITCKDFSSPTITNCTISNNTAKGDGGGINCINYSSPTITNCIISGNIAIEGDGGGGGGISCNQFCSPTITNCTISNNSSATYLGGGIKCENDSSPTIVNCIISGNSANYSGGGISFKEGSPVVYNCVISGNTTDYSGGGVFCNNATPTFTNCTISSNAAGGIEGSGGGIYNYHSSSISTLINCILWGNTVGENPNEIGLGDEGSINITYSDIQGGYTGTGNIDADPLFISSGNYNLKPGSPCIDKGTSSGAPTEDIEGTDRPQGLGYDMGAYEYPSGYSGCLHDGDVNQDGGITPQDALMVFQHYLGLITLSQCQQDHADVNNSGSITPADELCIFQKYLGLPSCLD